MATNITLPVPTSVRVIVVLAAVALFSGSVAAALFGNEWALMVLFPSSFFACRAVRYAFNR
jgi:hypothetical protein